MRFRDPLMVFFTMVLDDGADEEEGEGCWQREDIVLEPHGRKGRLMVVVRSVMVFPM